MLRRGTVSAVVKVIRVALALSEAAVMVQVQLPRVEIGRPTWGSDQPNGQPIIDPLVGMQKPVPRIME